MEIGIKILMFSVFAFFFFRCRVSVREEPTVGQKRTRREQQRDSSSRESTPVTPDRPASNSENVTTSLANNLPTNNNIKNVTASTTRHDTNGPRNRNARTEVPVKAQSNTVENTEPRVARASSLPLESKTCSGGKDSKSKITADTRIKITAETTGNTTRKVAEPKRNEQRAIEESRRAEDKNKSTPEGINDEIISVVIPNKCESASKKDSKDTKEAKGKQKRKTKAISKREDKDKKAKSKGNTTVKSKDDEGALSDDSCSDGSSDKSVPEVKIQQPSKDTNRTRQGGLPTDTQVAHLKEQQQGSANKPASHAANAGAESGDSGRDRGKGRKNHTTTDNTSVKSRKGEAQNVNGSARPKSLEVPAKVQNNGHTSKSQSNANSPDGGKPSELRHPGPTSPHAIAAAVMSLALGKNMQASSKENNFDEQDLNKRKAYTKTSALAPVLSDSPPPTSPTMLSGSSRSSSYSSIVSSDSSNGAEQVKPPVVKGNKTRVKGTKSVPLEGGAGPSWPSVGKSYWGIKVKLNFCLPSHQLVKLKW